MNFADVLSGASRFSIEEADATKFLKGLTADSVDFVFGSPPYALKFGRYQGAKARLGVDAWVHWMLDIVEESVRVCRGDVMFVVNGPVQKGQYWPAVEGLMWEHTKRGGFCERPCIWHKNSPPNRKDYFGNNWEFVVCFKKDNKPRAYFDWEAVAEAPKFKSGGHFRQRTSNGTRRKGNDYPQGKLARPRDVVRVTVGGGQMGSKLSSLNEAPFPERLAGHFVPVMCPPNGIVLDPFVGSGTTAKVTLNMGRRFIGCDLRSSQVELTERRILEECGCAASGTEAA